MAFAPSHLRTLAPSHLRTLAPYLFTSPFFLLSVPFLRSPSA
jgi:hypothetical protein